MYLNPKGRDWGSIVNWDDLGKLYAGFIVGWTGILLAGIIWLIVYRQQPFIKIRNLPLAISSTVFLHVYLVKICLAYTTNGHFLCAAEFWVMSIYLPFGIALFQANLVQLRSISDQQQKFLSSSDNSIRERSPVPPKRGLNLRDRWGNLTRVQKTYCYIATGMTVQLFVTLALYLSTPTLQGDWSSYGKLSYAKGQAKCRKSLQWIPSAFWQLFWSWMYGPYLLFRIRNIEDTHYWRLQVFLSVIAGLPGSPLWLSALFSPAFKPVNKWFVPPMWLAPGIIVMQGATIFFPIFEAYRRSYQMRKTLALLQQWDQMSGNSEERLIAGSRNEGSFAGSTLASSPPASSYRETELCSMTCLEKALSTNPIPLLRFAATRDFTAENVVFLMQLRRWYAAWESAPREDDGYVTNSALTNLFNMGVEIYVASVHEKTTDFPINIESRIRSNLDEIFAAAVPEGRFASEHGEVTQSQFGALSTISSTRGQLVTEGAIISHSELEGGRGDPAKAFWEKIVATETVKEQLFEPHPAVMPLGKARAAIREGFGEDVFKAAEKSIKYLVLTNTWQKFVKDGYASSRGRLSGETM